MNYEQFPRNHFNWIKTTRPSIVITNTPRKYRKSSCQHAKKKYDQKRSELPKIYELPDRSGVFTRTSNMIGEGAFSIVYIVENEIGEKYAGKFFTRTSKSSKTRLRRFEREVNLLSRLEHPNIVRFLTALSGVFDNKSYSEFGPHDKIRYFHPPVMIMEHCVGGSLSKFLKARVDRARHPYRKYGKLNDDETMWVKKMRLQRTSVPEE